mgnify:CR=1 FL=1
MPTQLHDWTEGCGGWYCPRCGRFLNEEPTAEQRDYKCYSPPAAKEKKWPT